MMNTFEIINIIQTTCPLAYGKLKGNKTNGMLSIYPYCKGNIVIVELSSIACKKKGDKQYTLKIIQNHHLDICSYKFSDHIVDTNGYIWIAFYFKQDIDIFLNTYTIQIIEQQDDNCNIIVQGELIPLVN